MPLFDISPHWHSGRRSLLQSPPFDVSPIPHSDLLQEPLQTVKPILPPPVSNPLWPCSVVLLKSQDCISQHYL